MKIAMIINPEFQKALMKLSNQELSPKAAKVVLGALRIVKDEYDKYQKDRIDYLAMIAEKDEDGKPKTENNGENFLIPEDKKGDLNKKLIEMMVREVELPTLSIDKLGDDIKLTAQELSLLESIIV